MIDILMATYNGELYVYDQIQSVLNQTYNDWILYIRDDGSKDNTMNIIKEFIDKYPSKIFLIDDDKQGLGAKKNFAELLSYSKNEYCMFCDQDDVWLENKIERTIEFMINAESIYGKKEPILVHSNLKVVDENLNVLDNSYFNFQGLNPNNKTINKLIVENNITGCTMLMNRALKDKIVDIPGDAIMHDWWIGLIATTLGKIIYIQEPTMLYRQHNNNEVGAKNIKNIKFLVSKFNPNEINLSIDKSINQARAFYQIYSRELSRMDEIVLEEFIKIKKSKIINRKKIALKNKFYKNNRVKKIVYLLFI